MMEPGRCAVSGAVLDVNRLTTNDIPPTSIEDFPVTAEMVLAGQKVAICGSGSVADIYRAMAGLVPKNASWIAQQAQIDRLTYEVAALHAERGQTVATVAHFVAEGERLRERIAALEAGNAALRNVPAAFTADLPDPPRRPDGTLAPQPKPWTPPKQGGDARRVGG